MILESTLLAFMNWQSIFGTIISILPSRRMSLLSALARHIKPLYICSTVELVAPDHSRKVSMGWSTLSMAPFFQLLTRPSTTIRNGTGKILSILCLMSIWLGASTERNQPSAMGISYNPDYEGLNDMLIHHREQVQDFIEGRLQYANEQVWSIEW